MNKYYMVTGVLNGRTEKLFGSFDKADCTYEIEAEKESWKGEGYKNIKISTKETADKPDKEVYNVQHSTFYTVRGKEKIYTTIKNTDHHEFLRADYNGKTYSHIASAALYFIEGIPLSAPIPFIDKIK